MVTKSQTFLLINKLYGKIKLYIVVILLIWFSFIIEQEVLMEMKCVQWFPLLFAVAIYR